MNKPAFKNWLFAGGLIMMVEPTRSAEQCFLLTWMSKENAATDIYLPYHIYHTN